MLTNHTKPIMARTLVLLLASFCLFNTLFKARSTAGGTCSASGVLKCNGKSYPQYRCSPPVTSSTQALFNLNDFGEGGVAPTECDMKFHKNSERVVALSTGWYNKGSRCGKMIRITAVNGRSTTAKVVDECDSVNGCDVEHARQPPCGNNVVDGSKGVWDALGLDANVGVENVTWSMAPFDSSESPHLSPLPQPPLAARRWPHTHQSPAPANTSYVAASNHWTWQKKVIIGVTGTVMVGLLIVCCFTCKLSRWPKKFWLTTQSNQDIEAFLKNNGALTLKRYKFSYVKKMTNSFEVKLGQGGFGAVYKGKLLNGSNVAVKMLNPSKGKGEEFINEVASISRTSHVNVVTLLGFCIEGRKKALIYEFMSNGSLDKFIYEKGHENTPSMTLSWDNLYQIAIGIARGLEYLHRGCNTRILHFDIKPHNILLDENFCPKISDFGLAKLCPRKESIISMSNARGTIGYVAPEVWNRHFGGVSHKSDVYSYGMMLLEIVGGRKNINAEASQTSEIYFPDWIYKRLEQDTHLGPEENVAIEENEIIKRMTMVGLWCIQTIPNDRPTMSRVVDMLEGNINSLEMPPKPVLSSPIRSMTASSTTVD